MGKQVLADQVGQASSTVVDRGISRHVGGPAPRLAGTGQLRRTLGVGRLTLSGLGLIVGAGIYVLIGSVAAHAGMLTPAAFVGAGIIAALTGLCYAELASRYPEAAGAAAYVAHGFGSKRLAGLVGLLVALVVGISAASIARGSAGYLTLMVDLPPAAAAGLVVVVLTGVACLSVRQSVGLAAAMSVIEVVGLLLVGSAGIGSLADMPARAGELLPLPGSDWAGLAAAAFLAFFAFTGFESLANMAEESASPGRTVSWAILLSLALSMLLYVLIALVLVLSFPRSAIAQAPAALMLLAERLPPLLRDGFAAIALLSIANGVLVSVLVLARLIYGLAVRALLPAALAAVDARNDIPLRATLLAGGLVLILTTTLPFLSLVSLTSTLTLLVFAAVSSSLWRIRRRRGTGPAPFSIPAFVAPVATLGSLLLAAASLLTL